MAPITSSSLTQIGTLPTTSVRLSLPTGQSPYPLTRVCRGHGSRLATRAGQESVSLSLTFNGNDRGEDFPAPGSKIVVGSKCGWRRCRCRCAPAFCSKRRLSFHLRLPVPDFTPNDLRDLFRYQDKTTSDTHDLLNCRCAKAATGKARVPDCHTHRINVLCPGPAPQATGRQGG